MDQKMNHPAKCAFYGALVVLSFGLFGISLVFVKDFTAINFANVFMVVGLMSCAISTFMMIMHGYKAFGRN